MFKSIALRLHDELSETYDCKIKAGKSCSGHAEVIIHRCALLVALNLVRNGYLSPANFQIRLTL